MAFFHFVRFAVAEKDVAIGGIRAGIFFEIFRLRLLDMLDHHDNCTNDTHAHVQENQSNEDEDAEVHDVVQDGTGVVGDVSHGC